MLRVALALAAVGLVACRCDEDCHSANAGLVPATPADPPWTCPAEVPVDLHDAERLACTFASGARVDATLGVSSEASRAFPIRHVVVLMQENRSFDHLLGRLHEQGQPEAEAVPASFSNVDGLGAAVAPFHLDTTCVKHDPNHQWASMHRAVNDGGMDGFVLNAAETTTTDGHFVMGYYDARDLPFLYWLSNQYAVNDRHFASVRSGTFPNRDFLYLATNDGVKETGLEFPDTSVPGVWTALEEAGFTWAAYSDGPLFSGAMNWTHDHAGAYCLPDFFERVDTGTLPNVAFVDARANVDGDHPPADVQAGEAFVRNVYQHLVASPQWNRTALIVTFDECGAYADHVPPPQRACIARPDAEDQPYFELGVRVPFILVSPWAKPHFVSHTVQEHTAITRFIETVFDLPALTARDANSPALLDLFDFGCDPPLLAPPPAPDAGTGGCR